MASDVGTALVLLAPSKAEVQERQVRKCGNGEVVIRIAAVGVCATDVELFDGTMGYYDAGLASWPHVPGHEWAGEIVALGPGVPPHLAIGQRVIGEHATGCEDLTSLGAEPAWNSARSTSGFMSKAFRNGRCQACAAQGGFLGCPRRAETGFFGRAGAFQTHMLFPAKQLHVLPSATPWDLAVLAEPLSTANKAIRLAGIDASSVGANQVRVVVVGDGPVGLLIVQALRWHGARVACVVGATASRLQSAVCFGAESVWDIKERGESGLAEALEEDGELPRTVIEAAGLPAAVPLSLKCVAPGGRVVLLGLSGNQLSQVCADDIVLRQLTVRGSLSSEPEDWACTAKMISSGALQSIVTHKLQGLNAYEEAISKVKNPPAGMLKLALFPNNMDSDDQALQSKRIKTS